MTLICRTPSPDMLRCYFLKQSGFLLSFQASCPAELFLNLHKLRWKNGLGVLRGIYFLFKFFNLLIMFINLFTWYCQENFVWGSYYRHYFAFNSVWLKGFSFLFFFFFLFSIFWKKYFWNSNVLCLYAFSMLNHRYRDKYSFPFTLLIDYTNNFSRNNNTDVATFNVRVNFID